MGINLPIVLYTHTDMKDIWNMVFGQTNKYLSDYKVYVAVNQYDESIPQNYTQLIYDDSQTYTERWKQILPQISEEVILFMHEDMIMLDTPSINHINTYYELVLSGRVYSVKLLLVGDRFAPSFVDSTLVSNQFSKLSIQPTIISKNRFLSILERVGSKNIWDFEMAITGNLNDFLVQLGNEVKRGMYHYDSIVFPYIATAINKGKWNYSEYKKELDVLSDEYNINLSDRGTV